MSRIEILAAILGVVSVYLTARQHWFCWPLGAVVVALYAHVFYDAKLYADMGLHVIYCFLQFYGWYQWLYGTDKNSQLAVSHTSPRLWAWLIGSATVFSGLLGYILSISTDASLPYIDSSISGFSLVAQYMTAKKKLENWLVWAAVDSVAIFVFVTKELYATALLYIIFLWLCRVGYREWQRALI